MDTVLRSQHKEIIIGPGRPFVVIGERINPTGRKRLGVEMANGDFHRVRSDAIAQVAAGAQMLDVNAGIPLADEPAILAEAIRQVQAVVDVPLSIDSSVLAALEAGLKAYKGKALVNSVTGEDERLEATLPLIAEYGAAVIGVTNDETGISPEVDVRFAVAKKIVERAEAFGIPREDVLIDPLAMPASAIPGAGKTLLELTRRVQEELGCNTVCGASNISFGLPDREQINATFMAMLIAIGMPAAITNPLKPVVRKAILAAEMLMGRDENCAAWLQHARQESAAADVGKSSPADDRRAARAARRARRQRREGGE